MYHFCVPLGRQTAAWFAAASGVWSTAAMKRSAGIGRRGIRASVTASLSR